MKIELFVLFILTNAYVCMTPAGGAGGGFSATNPEPNVGMAIAPPPMPEEIHVPPETVIAPLLVKPRRYTTLKMADKGVAPFALNNNPLLYPTPPQQFNRYNYLMNQNRQPLPQNNQIPRKLMQNIHFNSIREPVPGIEDKLVLSEDKRSLVTPEDQAALDSQKANEDLAGYSNDNVTFGNLDDILHELKMNTNDLHEIIRKKGIEMDQKMETLREIQSKYKLASLLEIN